VNVPRATILRGTRSPEEDDGSLKLLCGTWRQALHARDQVCDDFRTWLSLVLDWLKRKWKSSGERSLSSVRLAYLDEYAQKAEPMPFIGDDLLASFDDQRTRRGLSALAEIGARIQPILFTHHSRVVELAQQELGEKVDVVNLD
jgi:hypothetical protein